MPLRRISLITTAALLTGAVGAAGAATPAPGEFSGKTNQHYQGKPGLVKLTVVHKANKIKRLDVDVLLKCDQKGTFDTTGLFVTGVAVSDKGKVKSQGTFDRKLTSADGKPVVGTYTATLTGRFSRADTFKGKLRANVVYANQGTPYASCKSGTVRFKAKNATATKTTGKRSHDRRRGHRSHDRRHGRR
jgi:hypothetical protein